MLSACPAVALHADGGIFHSLFGKKKQRSQIYFEFCINNSFSNQSKQQTDKIKYLRSSFTKQENTRN